VVVYIDKITSLCYNMSMKESKEPGISLPEKNHDEIIAMVLESIKNINNNDWKPELEGNPEGPFVKSLTLIRERFDIPEGVTALYPGSATHTDVAIVFGKDNVTHVDPDEKACTALSDAGYSAVAKGIEEYIPDEPFDVMVLLNSYGEINESNKEKIRELVKPGGIIIANNYTEWAHDLAQLTDIMDLKGALLPDYHDPVAKFYEADEVPVDATEVRTSYYTSVTDGSQPPIKPGTLEQHDYALELPNNPDALFVFQVK